MGYPVLFNLSSVKNRREIFSNGENIIDFTEQFFVITRNLVLKKPPIIITKEFECRPHLIAKIEYGTEDYTDLLLMCNGIGSFAYIKEGMRLNIYTIDSMLANSVNLTSNNNKNNKNNDYASKLPKRDVERIKQLIKQETGIIDAEILAPNQPVSGTQTLTPSDGQIILGTNISNTRCKQTLSQNQSYTESIRKAVRDKAINS